jgi:hypothetical protein
MGSWFSKRETTNVPSQSESTATAEPEARLKELERHRPDYQLAGATHVTVLERRLRETAERCSRHLDLTAIGVCLRPRAIAPQSSREIAGDPWMTSQVCGGRNSIAVGRERMRCRKGVSSCTTLRPN